MSIEAHSHPPIQLIQESFAPAERPNLIEARDLLVGSWLLDGLSDALRERLVKNDDFLAWGGVTALSLPSMHDASRAYERERAHAWRMIMLADHTMQYDAFFRYKRGRRDILAPHNHEEQALLDFHAILYRKVLEHREEGWLLEEIVHQHCRPVCWGFADEHLPITPRGNRLSVWRSIGDSFELRENPRTVLHACFELRNSGQIIPEEIIDLVSRDFADGFQPRFWTSFPLDILARSAVNLGVDLQKLEPSQIFGLARSAENCHDECHFYHGSVHELKTLGELIAPVDAERFGEAILSAYKKWKRMPTSDRFQILIPAQADETTIAGILDYLHRNGVSQNEVIGRFHLELTDLCVTPMLRVYAELKRRGIIDDPRAKVNVRTMDVFRWKEKGLQFNFICTDHFIDLFPQEGPFSQENLLITLTRCLAPGGQLFLTARCGSTTQPLTSDIVLKRFYEKVNNHIVRLLDQLERKEELELTFDQIVTTTNTLISLLFYRQLREVYPFETRETIYNLFRNISRIAQDTEFVTERIGREKVKIVIKRR